MSKEWKRASSVNVRPFWALAQSGVGGALRNAKVGIGDDVEQKAGRILANGWNWPNTTISAHPNLDMDGLTESLGHRIDNTDIVVSFDDALFKKRIVADRFPLGRWPGGAHLKIGSELVREFDHGKGFDVFIALVMRDDTDDEPGWPNHAGTWLVRSVFEIRTEAPAKSPIKESWMTPNDAQRLTGYRKSILHVDYTEGQLGENAQSEALLATVRMAESLRPLADEHAEAQMLVEVACDIIEAGKEDIVEAGSVQPKSPLDNLLKALGTPKNPVTLETLKGWLSSDTPHRMIRNALHHKMNMIKHMGGG